MPRKKNKTGHKGVSICPGTSKYITRVWYNKKCVYLGLYDSIEEACEAQANFIKENSHDNYFKEQDGELMSMVNAAKFLRISTPTLRKIIKKENIQCVTIGRKRCIHKNILEKILIPVGSRKCIKCNLIKPLTDFRKNEISCLICKKQYKKKYHIDNKERYKENQRIYRKSKRKEINERERKNRVKRRTIVISKYGSTCQKCGEANPNFLTIDHTNGDGNIHRKEMNNRNIYDWLIKNNFPQDGFQLLCYNCNCSKNSIPKNSYYNSRHKRNYDKLKRIIFKEYGEKCSCCGINDINMLTIEHVNNNGAIERKEIGAGHAFFLWLRRNNYPKEGYDVLCYNCNIARYRHGCCHKKEITNACTKN